MKRLGYPVLLTAARTFTPAIALFAFSLLALQPAGSGVSLAAGLGVALVVALHALTFGVEAACAAAPPWLLRVLAAAGFALAGVAAGLPRLPFAPQLMEAGAFAAVAAGVSLVALALFGRAPSLRDAEG